MTKEWQHTSHCASSHGWVPVPGGQFCREVDIMVIIEVTDFVNPNLN